MKMKSLSRVRPSATPWTAAFQAPPSMGFSRQEYWSGVPLPSPNTSLSLTNFSFKQRKSRPQGKGWLLIISSSDLITLFLFILFNVCFHAFLLFILYFHVCILSYFKNWLVETLRLVWGCWPLRMLGNRRESHPLRMAGC